MAQARLRQQQQRQMQQQQQAVAGGQQMLQQEQPASLFDLFYEEFLTQLMNSGGNLAECYMHGLGLNIEAVRQIRGQSTSQVEDANVSMVISGPMVTPVSCCIFGSEATL